MRLLRASIAAALLCAALLQPARAAERARLPLDVFPISYDLRVSPDLSTRTTPGTETIVLRAASPVDHVALNALGISIAAATIDGVAASVQPRRAIQQVWFSSGAVLAPGRHVLHVRFTSTIYGEDKSEGLFDAGFGERPFLVTMFEPSTAREFFPCFDEPQFRAPIALHVTAPPSWTVVSNMPGSHRLAGNRATWDFEPTPAMPVYLLTLDAGRMARASGEADGVPVNVYTPAGDAATPAAFVRRTLADGERAVRFYDAYVGVRYPLPKLDLIVAPFGEETALEQWGAITFYTPDILGGNFKEPDKSRREAFETAAHEIAHQWFGDLVGMRWWGDAFVAEGLAEFAQEQADAAAGPRQQWWEDDDEAVDSVMDRGISARTNALTERSIAGDGNREDWAAFDDATYYKSAAVVRMWREYIGPRVFRAGLHAYVKKNAGRAVGVETFWRSFGSAQAAVYGKDWIERPGFPIVTVSSACRNGRTVLAFAQQPFTNGKGAPAGYARRTWPVPIVVTQGSRRWVLLLRDRSMHAVIGPCAAAYAIDRGLRPYYRLRYTGAALQHFVRGLSAAAPRDRANALRDARQLFEARAVPAGYFLDVLSQANTRDSLLLRRVGMTLSDMLATVPRGPERDALARLVRRVAGPLALGQMRVSGSASDWTMVQALAQAGDSKLAQPAAAALQRLYRNGRYQWSDDAWFFAELAGPAADAHTVARLERAVVLPPPYATYPVEFSYLTAVTQPDLVRQILEYYAGEPSVVFALARRSPLAVWAYLARHAPAVRRHAPPSQQGWVLADGVARTMWDVVPPGEIRRFLDASLGPAYRADVAAAMKSVYARRRAGAALAAQIAAWMAAPAEGAVTVRRMSSLHGKGGPNRGAGLPHRHGSTGGKRARGGARS